MVLQCKKNTSLLELLESHAGGSTPEVVVQTQPLTPLPTHISPSEQPKKKIKREKKRKETSKEGEMAPKDLEPEKGAKVAKGAQRKNTPEGLDADIVVDRRPSIPVQNLMLKLDWGPLPLDSSISNF